MKARALPLFIFLIATACNDDKKATTATATTTTSTPSAPVTPPSSSSPAAAASSPTTAPVVPDAITAQHVLVAWKGAKDADKSITRSKADAKKRAEEVITKAKAGTDFTALVSEYSDDPGSKARQGSVGKFTRSKMTKPFSDAAFLLAVDEVSGVVESEFGYHVIKRNQ